MPIIRGKEKKAIRVRALNRLEYDPLKLLEERRKLHYSNMVKNATEGSFIAMIRLNCLDCCGWDTAEPKKCEIRHCAFWPIARKEFLKDEMAKEAGT